MMTDKKAELIAQCDPVDAQHIVSITLLLGIPTVSKGLGSDIEVHDLLQKGLPAKVLRSLLNKTGLNSKELSTAVSIPDNFLQEMVVKTNRNARLPSLQSDALWKFASIFVNAKEVFGSTELAKEWLCSKAPSLQYRKPIGMLSLSLGADLVMRVLNQLDHGVYI